MACLHQRCVRCDETTAPRSRRLKSCSDFCGGIAAGESGGGEPPRRLSGGTCSGCCTGPRAAWRRHRGRRCPNRCGHGCSAGCRARTRSLRGSARTSGDGDARSAEASTTTGAARSVREDGVAAITAPSGIETGHAAAGATTRPVEAVQATRRSAAPGYRGCAPCRRGSR